MLRGLRALLRPRHVALLALGAGGALCYYESDAPPAERLQRWQLKWAAGDIKFHKRDVHPALAAHYEQLFPDGKPHRVLVPLCGKTVDMPFLARKGHEVVGIEGVPAAAEAFAREHPTLQMARCGGAPDAAAPPDYVPADAFGGARPGFVFTTREGKLGYHRDLRQAAEAAQPDSADGAAPAAPPPPPPPPARADWLSAGASPAARPDRRAVGGSVWLSVCDWFSAATPRSHGTFARAWDRGGLVAVPPAMRPRYAATLDALLEPGGRLLLSCYEYEQQAAPGPPFALSAGDVRALFPAPAYRVAELGRVDVSAEFRRRKGTPWEGIGRMDELRLLVVKRRPWWRRALWPFGAD